MAGIEEGRPQGDLIPFRDTRQTAEGNLPVAAAFGQLSETPDGVDPAYWPIQVLKELNAYILDNDTAAAGRLNTLGFRARELGERFAPLKDHMQKVTTAYAILAYPHCKYELSRENIEDQLRRDRESNERDQVELNDTELQILTKLTAARKLPFNPEKRVYTYDEVFHPSQDIEPALNAAQFLRWQGEQKRANEQGSRQ
jgi:hypothetical protein